jgi:hypothetical protein
MLSGKIRINPSPSPDAMLQSQITFFECLAYYQDRPRIGILTAIKFGIR